MTGVSMASTRFDEKQSRVTERAYRMPEIAAQRLATLTLPALRICEPVAWVLFDIYSRPSNRIVEAPETLYAPFQNRAPDALTGRREIRCRERSPDLHGRDLIRRPDERRFSTVGELGIDQGCSKRGQCGVKPKGGAE
jgi:hypothetical protein